jgi:predicted N-acetyltransferase YhbS
MTFHKSVHDDPGLGAALEIRPVTPDDFSTLRYIHERAALTFIAPLLSEAEAEALARHVRSPSFTDELLECEIFAGVLNGQLVGTAAWSASDDSGTTARIGSVSVDPMFAGSGIGRRLVADVEARALHSGFTRFALRSTLNAVTFFQRIGYEIASHGVSPIAGSKAVIPVAFMRKSIARVVNAAPQSAA